MLDIAMPATVLGAALALISLGGGLYEYSVVDPFWPSRPDLIQPDRGGISRKRFWIPAHTVFEIVLIIAVVTAWSMPSVRVWLLVALASHVVMRLWSAFDFIPRALAFEKAEQVDRGEAVRWTRRSLLRLPLDLVTSAAMLAAVLAW